MARGRENYYAFTDDRYSAKAQSRVSHSPYANQMERLVLLFGGLRRFAKVMGLHKRDVEFEIKRGTVKDWRWIRILHVARLDGVYLFDHVFDPRPMRYNYFRQEWEL